MGHALGKFQYNSCYCLSFPQRPPKAPFFYFNTNQVDEDIEAAREKMKDGALKYAARSLNIDISLLTIVTEEEYQKETEDN